MSLTDEDLSQVRDIIVGAIEALVLPRFDEHDKRFDEHDKRFEALEKDVRTLTTDMREVKEDVRVLKTDMREVKDSLGRLEGRVEALEADVKELYRMVATLSERKLPDERFTKLPVEQKVIQLYQDLQALAKQAGVTLPR